MCGFSKKSGLSGGLYLHKQSPAQLFLDIHKSGKLTQEKNHETHQLY